MKYQTLISIWRIKTVPVKAADSAYDTEKGIYKNRR